MAFKLETVGIGGVENYTCNTPNSRSNDEELKDDGETEGIRSFAQDTTLHGARFLFVSNVFRRVVWGLALISCLAYCSYQVYSSVTTFYSHPFHTKITTTTTTIANDLPFPAVTLCSVNALNTRRFRVLYEHIHNGTATEEQITRKLEDISLMISGSKEVLTEEFRKRNPLFFHREKSAKEIIKLYEFVSHQIDEMLLPSGSALTACSMNGLTCGAKNFSNLKVNAAYGQCYTFNSAEGVNPLLNATLAGQNSGLKLRLNVEQDSYIRDAYSPTVGLAVIVHDQRSFPYMEEFGVIIQPGRSTQCAIKRREIINLRKPYATNCTDETSNAFSSDSIYAYTKQACLRKCLFNFIIKTCGCTPPEHKANAPICAVNDTLVCSYPAQETFGISKEKYECEKNCPQPCKQVEYETSCSYGGLQREALVDHLLSVLNGSNSSSVGREIYEPLLNMTKLERKMYIDDNIISLDIYFDDLTYEVIRQEPLFETWAMIGNLGGTFGLFLGMSCLTLLEFVDFLFRKFCHLFRKQAIAKRRVNARNITVK